MSAVEDEREISADEYERLLEKRDTRLHPINKVRHTFFYKGHTFEVDGFPRATSRSNFPNLSR